VIEGIIPAEIRQGPSAIRATVADLDAAVRGTAAALRRRGTQRLWAIGNGTSYHSCLCAAGLYRRLARPDDPVVIPMTAGEFRALRPALGDRDAVVGVSASGEFRDVVAVFEELRGHVPTVGVVHVPGSTLPGISDHVLVSSGGPSSVPVMTKTFSATLTATAMLVAAFLGESAFEDVRRGLVLAADQSERAIDAAFQVVETLASTLASAAAEHVFVVGGGGAWPAAMEAALKLKEMALIHAEAAETWEMMSGPATLVGPHTTVVSLAPDGPARNAAGDVVRSCAEWGAPIVEVAHVRSVDRSVLLPLPQGTDDRFAALTTVPPVALLAYALAGLRGATPDRPSWTGRYHRQGLTHILGA
jgi:glucosamine--fructose-6-phosphate aminotransferase (isomerizing)